MIIEYDRSANLSAEQQLRSLQESVQRAFDEITTAYRDDLSTSSGELYTTINLFRKDYAYFNQITTEKLDADRAFINQLFAKDAVIEGTLEAHAGRFEDLEADYAEIDALVVSHTASINQLTAEDVTINNSLRALTGRIGTIEANYITSEQVEAAYLKVGLANLDTANIDKAKVGQMIANVGLIDRATIVDGHVTGYLDSVSINANSITAGTLTTNRLLLAGDTGSILYELNNLGQLVSQNVNTLDGYVLTPRTINADRIVASSITANELDVASVTAATVTASNVMALNLEAYDLSAWQATIGGFHIGEAALYSPVEQYLWDPVLVEESEHLERSAMNENLDLSEDTSTWLYDDLTGNEMAALNVEYDLSEPTDAWMTTVTYPEYRELCLLNDIDPELYSSVYLGTDAIGLGDNFYVDIDGNMEAKNVDITGHIVATSGEISGSLLVGRIADPNENTVFDLTTGDFKMSKGSIKLGELGENDYNFSVNDSGYMDVKNGRIRLGWSEEKYRYNFDLSDTGILKIRRGEINMGDGKFRVTDAGYVDIRSGYINLGNGNLVLGSNGTINITQGYIDLGNGNFSVDNSGHVNIRSGHINLGDGNLIIWSDGEIQITYGSINLGNGNFYVGDDGRLTANGVDLTGKITASSGAIGGFTIGSTGLVRGTAGSSGYVYLGTSGIRAGTNFSVLNDGTLTARAGSFGKWTIEGASLMSHYGVYTAYLQEPGSANTYVFLIQRESGGSVLENFYVTTGGDVGGKSWSTISDRKYKEDISPLNRSAVDFIMQLEPVRYRLKDEEDYHHGFIAQEVRDIRGDNEWAIVSATSPMKEPSDTTLMLRYQEIIADLVKTAQVQWEEIQKIKQKLN